MGSDVLMFATAIATFGANYYLLTVQMPRLRQRFKSDQLQSIGCFGVAAVLAILIAPGLLGLYKANLDIWSAIPVVVGLTGWLFFGNLLLGTWRPMSVPVHPLPPEISDSKILFQELRASGYSRKSFLTRIGGAGNCLRLVVTETFLWTTVNLRFFDMSGNDPNDLQHLIPINRITDLKETNRLGVRTLDICFTDSDDQPHVFCVRPDDMDAFRRALDHAREAISGVDVERIDA